MYLFMDPDNTKRVVDIEAVAVIYEEEKSLRIDDILWPVAHRYQKSILINRFLPFLGEHIFYENFVIALHNIKTVRLVTTGISINGIFYYGEHRALFNRIVQGFQDAEISNLERDNILIALNHIKNMDLVGKFVIVNNIISINMKRKKKALGLFEDLTRILQHGQY